MSETCLTCGARLEVRCPCARPECALVTPVKVCWTCQPEAAQRLHKMVGLRVCEAYIAHALGVRPPS